MNALRNTMQVRISCGDAEAWLIRVPPSFILHRIPACITFQWICCWWDPSGCASVSRGSGSRLPAALSSVLCLCYCNCVFSEIFCSNARQLKHNKAIPFALCLVWMMQREILAQNNVFDKALCVVPIWGTIEFIFVAQSDFLSREKSVTFVLGFLCFSTGALSGQTGRRGFSSGIASPTFDTAEIPG